MTGMLLRTVPGLVLALVVLLAPLSVSAALLVPGEPQSFRYDAAGAFAGTPITVHYYKPATAAANAKVLFALHGAERNGKRARDNWIDFAQKNNFIVLAPEFDALRFPLALFQLGGMEERDSARWTFTLIEQLFDRVSTAEALTTPTYAMFGHSAGGQFVQRFVLMMDKARLGTAVAANAGSYTMPVLDGAFDQGFPYALDERRVTVPALQRAMQRHLVVLLGEQDTLPDGPGMRRSRPALVQGANRLQRGRNFFEQAGVQADRLGTELRWQIVTVPGVGHDSREMSQAAGPFFIQEPVR